MSRIRVLRGWFIASVFGLLFGVCSRGEAKLIQGELFVVPADKLPVEARQQGQSMDLYLVEPNHLYLYVEQDNGKHLAVFDVSDPHRMKFKKMIELNAPAIFDFMQHVGPHTALIHYRDGRGTALIDLSKPKDPRLRSMNAPASEAYVLPVNEKEDDARKGRDTEKQEIHDYQILLPATTQPIAIVKGVQQEESDSGNGTIYLLGADGLTVVRNIKCERKLAAMTPPWTNTIDDN